jgi:hypothetical protein
MKDLPNTRTVNSVKSPVAKSTAIFCNDVIGGVRSEVEGTLQCLLAVSSTFVHMPWRFKWGSRTDEGTERANELLRDVHDITAPWEQVRYICWANIDRDLLTTQTVFSNIRKENL